MKRLMYMVLMAISTSFIGSYLLRGAAGSSEPTLTERIRSYIPAFLIPDMGERSETAEDLYADIPLGADAMPASSSQEGDDDYELLDPVSPIAPLELQDGHSVICIKNSTSFNLYVVYRYGDSWTSQVVDRGTLVPLGLMRKVDAQTIRIKTYGKYAAIGARNYSLADSGLVLPTEQEASMVCVEITLDESITRYVRPYVFRLNDEQPPRYTTLAEVFPRAYNKLSYKEQLLGSTITQTVGEVTATIAQNVGESIKQGAQAELRKAFIIGAQSKQFAYALLGSPWANSEYYRYHDNPAIGPKMKANIEAAYESRFDSLRSGLWVDLADSQLVEDVLHILLLATRTLLSTTEIVPSVEELAAEEDLARRVNERLLLYDPNRAPRLRVER